LERSPATAESQNEQTLGDEIASLWSAHTEAKNTARATRDELRVIRAKLGEHLHEMKGMLASPGCAGQWSGFLRKHNIPRATADRLVGYYEQSINPDANSVTEAISEPTEEEVQKLLTSVWPKLRRTLRSRQSLLLFIDLLTSHCESSEGGSREITVLAPALPTSCPASSDSVAEPLLGATVLVTRADEEAS